MVESGVYRHRMNILRTLLTAGLLLAVPASWLLAAGAPSGPPFQVNTFTQATQQNPAVGRDGAGNFVVVWTSWDGIRARHFDAAAFPKAAEFLLVPGDDFPDADVAMDAAGNYVVVWTQSSPIGGGGVDLDVIARRFDAAGAPRGPAFTVNGGSGLHHLPAVAMNAAGHFVIAWTSYVNFRWSAQATSYDGSGNVLGGAQVVSPTDLDDPGQAAVAINPAGDFVVAWEMQGSVHARTFGADGTGVSPVVLASVATDNRNPAAGIDGFGRFVVAWDDRSSVFLARFEPDGSPLGSTLLVNDAAVSPFAQDPAVAMGATGEFVVVGHAYDPNDNPHVFARSFDASGTPEGSEFPVDDSNAVQFRRHPAVAMSANQGLVVAWTRRDDSEEGVFARRYVGVHSPNTASGVNVPVTPASITSSSPVSLTFSNVTEAGDSVSSQTSGGPGAPAGFRLGDPPVYYELSTTAVFSGPIRVCISYAGITYTGDPLLFHFENGAWVELPGIVDDKVNQIVCADTTSLSPFGLFEVEDMTPPTIVPSVVGVQGNGGWYTSAVSVTWTVTDPESAISSPSGCGATTVVSDTAGTTFTCEATSGGGSASASVTIKRDATPPSITVTSPSAGAVYELNQIVAASYACADDLSDLAAPCVGSVPNGANLDTATPGPKVFTVPAVDLAGNATSRSVSYQVQAACHYVSLALNPSTVPQGGLTTVSATVRSCASTAQTVAIRFALAGPTPGSCGGSNSVMFTTPPFTLPPGTVRTVSFPFRVPSRTCPGTYSIAATTLVNGTPVDATSTSLTVTRR